MKILVHAGLQKTGSSALQEYLYAERHRLLEHGIMYPDLGHRSHWMLAGALAKSPMNFHHARRRLDKDERLDELKGAVDTFSAMLRDAQPDQTMLISHEGFSIGKTTTRLFELVQSVRPDTTIEVIAYVRDPLEHFSSAVQQVLKNDRARSFAPSEWLSPHVSRVLNLLDGPSTPTVRIYSRATLENGDVIADFRSVLRQLVPSLPEMAATAITTNSSLTAKACAVLSICRQLQTPEQRQLLRRAVRNFDDPELGPKLVMPQAWRSTIEATNAPAWNAMMRKLKEAGAISTERLLAEGERLPLTDHDVDAWLQSALSPEYLNGLIGQITAKQDGKVKLRDKIVTVLRDVAERIRADT